MDCTNATSEIFQEFENENRFMDEFRLNNDDEWKISSDAVNNESYFELLDLNNFFYAYSDDIEKSCDGHTDIFDSTVENVTAKDSTIQISNPSSSDVSNCEIFSNQCIDNNDNNNCPSTTSSIKGLIKPFLLAINSNPIIQSLKNVTTFQLPNETRMKYLIRYPKLQEQFFNSGELEKLKILFNDVMVRDVVLFPLGLPAIVGRDKVFEVWVSMFRNVPDLCVFSKHAMRSRHRLITFKARSYGTVPSINTNDKTTVKWNVFEYTSMVDLDEFHKLQKQKYDMLKSQKKMIRYEKTSTVYLYLDKNLQYIIKIMYSDEKIEILT